MGDREVTIHLRADVAAYIAAMKLAAAETQSFGRNTDQLRSPLQKVEQQSKQSGKEIDKLSGRLGVLADAALTLGPALIPLGAATIPVLTGALAGLGAAAGGIGVTVLAFKGLGDGIKAIDAYRLEPTVENLQKMRIEQEKLGPAGAEFSRYIANLEPSFRSLQNTARAGLFPGVEDGIDAFLTRAPEVTKIINRLSQGMGDIARGAGTKLAGSDFDAFFKYIETDARPTLEAFAQSAGNVALGVANMIVAFAPLSRDFTGGLVDATDAFAKWSQGLDDNQSFQDFVDYVRTSGPQATAFLGAVAKAILGLLQAAAPLGQVVLPALTELAKAFAAIASSPIGPGLYAAAAGLVAFNRAAALTTSATGKLTTTFEGMSRGRMAAGAVGGLALLASSLTDVDDKAGMANTTLGASAGLMAGGPWGLAIGAAIGQVLDFKDAYDQANGSITAADDAMRNNDTTAMLKEQADLVAQLAKEHPDNGTLGNYFDAVKGSFHDFTGQTQDFKDRLAEIRASLSQGGDAADLFGETIGLTGNQMRSAAASAVELEGALAHLSGWFDKRDAVRSYKDSIDALKGSLKDGFTRDDVGNIDAIGRSILQVAQNIKNPGARGDFLEQARAQLVDMANHSGPKAAAAIDEVVRKFDSKGLTHPVIKPEVDTAPAKKAVDRLWTDSNRTFDIMNRLKARPTVEADDTKTQLVIRRTNLTLSRLDHATASPKVTVDAGGAESIIGRVASMLRNLNGTVANTYVRTNHIGGVTSSSGGHSAPGSALGGTVPKTGLGYADRHPYLLADGEEVISNRFGQADRHRALLKKINAGMADGGTSGGGPAYHSMLGGGDGGGVTIWTDGVYSVAKALKALKAELDAETKAVDKAKKSRDALVEAEQSFVSSVSGAYSKADLFSGDLSSFDTGAQANANDTAAAQLALTQAASHGLDGALYQALAASGNLTLLQQFAGLSSDQIQIRENEFAAQSNAQGALGSSAAAQAGYVQAIKDQTHELKEAQRERRNLQQAVKEMQHRLDKLPDKVEAGARAGVGDQQKRTHTRTRTGG